MTDRSIEPVRFRLRCLLAAGAVLSCLGVAGCGSYVPGRDGSRPVLIQNQSSNSEPESAGSRPH